jgi:hypothetical protein
MPKAILYEIGQEAPFRISRSKLENFVKCPRCFVLDRRHKIAAPSGPAFTLNSAVDGLLKKEFDACREQQTVHPELARLGYDFIPYKDERIPEWQNMRKGVVHHDPASNLILYGAIDDLWSRELTEQLFIVDYKTTSKAEPIVEMGDEEWHNAYRRQLDIYNYLLGHNQLEMSDKGYWFYATAKKNADNFEMKLQFEATLIEYTCDTSWIEGALLGAKTALENPVLVEPSSGCSVCVYFSKRENLVTGPV